jgi:hypothetical protein
LQHKLKTYLKPALLMIDEVGYLRLDRVEANYLFQLVCRRYERGSIIVTSDKAFSEWAELLGDEVLTAAILDRLLHHAEVLPINGPSYRLKDWLGLARSGRYNAYVAIPIAAFLSRKGDCRVWARGTSASHAAARSRCIGAAVARCCEWVLASLRYRECRRSVTLTP